MGWPPKHRCQPVRVRLPGCIAHFSLPEQEIPGVARQAPAGFSKNKRLINAADYSRVFDNADARASHRNLLLLARANGHSEHRLGLVIAKKHVRLAVDRNRVKRLAREFFRQQPPSEQGLDVVLLARGGLGALDNEAVSSILQQQWRKLLTNFESSEHRSHAQQAPDTQANNS